MILLSVFVFRTVGYSLVMRSRRAGQFRRKISNRSGTAVRKTIKKNAFPKIKEVFLLFFDFVLYTSKCRQKQIFHYRLFYMTPCLSQQTYLEFGRFLILCLYGFLFKSLSLQLWIKLFLIVFLPGFFFRIDAMSVAYNFRLEFKTKKTYLLIEKNQNGHD